MTARLFRSMTPDRDSRKVDWALSGLMEFDLLPEDLRIDSFVGAGVSVRITHVPSGLSGEGTHPKSQLLARRDAEIQLVSKLRGVLCDRCGTLYYAGDWPWCRPGHEEDHKR